MNSPTISESESTINVALVRRVSDRMAAGVPLGLALAGELVSYAEYDEFLRRHPELAAEQGFARRRFFQNAVGTLLDAKDSSANIRWLLERLYPDVLAQPPRGPDRVAVNVTTVTGMPEDELQLLREEAAKL